MNAEWRLTVADVLKRPLFQHASLVAGARGLARPVRWVHVLETAETGSFLNGGELILSTGLGFGENARKRRDYLAELIRRKAVGLCVELGAYVPAIPDDMRELADHHDFPLIAFHEPVRFVDITLDLHELIVNRHTQALRRLEAYSRQLQKLALKANGLGRLLAHFQEIVGTQAFVWALDGPPLFSPPMPQAVQAELLQLLDDAYQQGRLSRQESGVLAITGKKQILYQPIAAMGHVLAYLGAVLYEREADEFLLLTLDYTATAMAQILLRKMFAEERALDSQNRLLDELLQDRVHHEEHIRSMLNLHRERTVPRYLAVIAEIAYDGMRYAEDEEAPFHDVLSTCRSILTRRGFRSLVRARGNRLYFLLIEQAPRGPLKEAARQALAEIEQVMRHALGSGVRIRFGAGRLSDAYAEAKRHFDEAEQALSFTGESASPFFDDLGVWRLLMHVQDPYVLRSFVSDYLEPLIRYDDAHGTQLLATLRALLEHNGSKQEAAERLYIRRQTLYHRLEKIRELIGDTFLEPEHRLCFELALKAYDWLYQAKAQRCVTS